MNTPAFPAASRTADSGALNSWEYRREARSLLARIRALVRRTAQTPRALDDYVAHLEGRLGALARAQEIWMRAPSAGIDLMELISDEFLAQGIPAQRVEVEGEPVSLAVRTAAPLALALHELTTNSIKFGALATPQGKIRVRWACNVPRILLEWSETASAEPGEDSGERAPGFGMELLERTLSYEIAARTRLQFAPEGFRCEIDFLPGDPKGSGERP
jgi:two-component system, chemotaxis family, CheB/CheR fusion protein